MRRLTYSNNESGVFGLKSETLDVNRELQRQGGNLYQHLYISVSKSVRKCSNLANEMLRACR